MVTPSLYRSLVLSKSPCLYIYFFKRRYCLYKQLFNGINCLRIQFPRFHSALIIAIVKIKKSMNNHALHIDKVQQYFADANHKKLIGVGHGY